MESVPSIGKSCTTMSITRYLGIRNYFNEYHGVRPNSNWLSQKALSRLLTDAEHTHDVSIMRILEHRAEYLQWGNRCHGWLRQFLHIKLFDFHMSRFDVRTRFRHTSDDDIFYCKARNDHKAWSQYEHALEIGENQWHPKKKQRYI